MNINEIEVKRIKESCFNEVIELVLEVMSDFNQLPIELKRYNHFKEYYMLSTYLDCKKSNLEFYGAFYQNKLVGIIGNDENNLSHFFVKKEFQNKKIGLLLMKNYLNRMKENNYNIVSVDASKYAHNIYKKMGFQDRYEQDESKNKYEMIYRMDDNYGI